jgi:ABC-2 type transport system ATP-binding protein
MNLLEIKNLKKYFATQKAVDDISFGLQQGSIFGLLGPNGAGKTTLIRMITGIFYPDEGEILLNGKSLTRSMTLVRLAICPKNVDCIKK